MESGPAVGQVSTSLDICVYYTITALETQGPDHGHKVSDIEIMHFQHLVAGVKLEEICPKYVEK